MKEVISDALGIEVSKLRNSGGLTVNHQKTKSRGWVLVVR